MGNYIRFFNDLNNKDTAEVGGKNASLGEICREPAPHGACIQDGYATTAEAFRNYLKENVHYQEENIYEVYQINVVED